MTFLGGKDGSSINSSNDILEYNPLTEEWQKIGTMKEGRYAHAVTHVSFKDFAAWCK